MRPRWLSKRALLLHLALLIWFPGCVIAGWWQADATARRVAARRAAQGPDAWRRRR